MSSAPSLIERCDFAVGERIDSKYTVLKTLGEGSFGKVYLVEDNASQKFALKLLRLWDVHPDIREPLMERFEMEFKTGQIDSEYLVHALDYGVVGGNPYIVMEFCTGGDLTPLLGRAGDRAPIISQQILLGLHALHTRGKVHRDIKPENVLFKANGNAGLTDFGIAGDRNKRMTERNIFGKPNQIFGTYAYMPPEQVNRARGEATVLPTTDIFSFGVLAFQLLTGELPFGPLTDHNDLVKYQKRGKAHDWDQDRLARLPDGRKWISVIGECLQPNFKNRLQSVEAVLKMLPSVPHVSVRPARDSGFTRVERPKGFCLRVMQGEDFGKIFSLTEIAEGNRRIITMGRNDKNTIVLTERWSNYLSRWHCTIETDQKKLNWLIRDGQWRPDEHIWRLSSNGTYVNSSQVDKNGLWLSVGDIITVGDIKIRFEQY